MLSSFVTRCADYFAQATLRAAVCKTWLWYQAHYIRGSFALLLTIFLVVDLCFPPPIPHNEAGLIVVARDGSPLRGWPDSDGIWRYPTSPEEVSPHYVDALTTYEDRWFYYHPGVNPIALLRATGQYLRYGEIVSGGSTLTMQVARSIEPIPHTLSGKFKQMFRALQLELRLSKKEILTLYLNRAPMGGIVEGVEMASRTYLGKPAKQLTQAESALLVVLPQSPSRLRPDRHPQRAQAARDKVLHRMNELGRWKAHDVEDALMERVGANPPRLAWLAPLAAERLHQIALKDNKQTSSSFSFSLSFFRKPPPLSIVQSTIDRDVQTILEQLLSDRVGQLPRHVSMSALVMDVKTCEVLGYVGSADFNDHARFNHVDMVKGIRSPGSTLKPFLYAMALDEGLIHSESLLADTPQSFAGYEPGNFQANFSGPVSVSDALQRSLNVPAVDLLDRIGPNKLVTRLGNAGLRLRIAQKDTPNLSVILGGAGTNLEELVGAYRALAANGMTGTPRMTKDAPMKETRIMSAGAAFIIRQILENGGHPDQPFVETKNTGNRLAWKTGTSYGFRDAWAVGVSGKYALGVWVGKPDGTPNPGFFGANVAAPLLKHISEALPNNGFTPLDKPAEVSTASICWPLGVRAEDTEANLCHEKRLAWLLNSTAPPTLPDRIRNRSLIETVWINAKNGLRTTPQCDPEAQARRVARWPALLEAWIPSYKKETLGLVAWDTRCPHPNEGARLKGSLKLMGLHNATRLRPSPQEKLVTITLDAVGGVGTHYWLLDGKLIENNSGRKKQVFSISESGAHQITVMDVQGRSDSVAFTVDAVY